MKKSQKGKSPTRSKLTVDPISDDVASRRRQSGQSTGAEIAGEERETLSRLLHELLNSLWPAAARIELAVSEETCPPNFRELLKQLERCVDDAMTIASRASVLVDSPTSELDAS